MNPTTKLKSALETTGLNLMPWSTSYSKLRAAVEEVIGELEGEAAQLEAIRSKRNKLHDTLHMLLRSDATEGRHPDWHEAFEVDCRHCTAHRPA